jgi:hypothetical protein
MNPDTIKTLLVYSLLFNYGILLIWFGVFRFSHDWLYRFHSRWFSFSLESFDTLNYGCMAIYKIGIMLFNVVPLLALWIVF